MSGGHFEYKQFAINDIIEQIEDDLKMEPTEFGDAYLKHCSEETISKIKEGLHYLKLAKIYTHRIDWFMSGDDGEETFHKRLQEELNAVNSK